MSGGENFLAQLKAVVDPLTVFTHYLSLKKSGARYRALCPFHSEKTPSFYADEKGMFHCFGCGAGGDVIKFVMMMEKISFKECIQLLSSRYGIPLKFAAGEERKEKEELLDLMRQTCEFYHNLLTTHSSGNAALEYLEQRRITRDTIRKFQLGWAPASWHVLLEHFQKRDVPPEMLEKCGLVVARQQEGYYDRYRSRIIIPIHDIHGNIIALGGRIFQGSGEEAKYLNSPETLLYSKSNHLFGFYFSKESIQSTNLAILVEGYFDMIVPYQAGIQHIVASLGTSLTENQARLLRRYTDRVLLLYDPDNAGQSAVFRALPILLKEGLDVQVVSLPEGLDPDEFVRKEGPEEFQKELDQAIRYDQFFLKNLMSRYDMKIPADRLAAAEELIALLAHVGNPFERDRAMNHFANALGVSVNLLLDLFKRKYRKGQTSPIRNVASPQKITEAEKKLLQIILLNPEAGKKILREMHEEDFEEFVRADLFRTLHQIFTTQDSPTTEELIHSFPEDQQSALTALVLTDELPRATLEYAEDWLERIRINREERKIRALNSQVIETAPEQLKAQLLEEKLRKRRELHQEELRLKQKQKSPKI